MLSILYETHRLHTSTGHDIVNVLPQKTKSIYLGGFDVLPLSDLLWMLMVFSSGVSIIPYKSIDCLRSNCKLQLEWTGRIKKPRCIIHDSICSPCTGIRVPFVGLMSAWGKPSLGSKPPTSSGIKQAVPTLKPMDSRCASCIINSSTEGHLPYP